MSESNLELAKHILKIKGFDCGCYIGETESLGQPIIRWCAAHHPKNVRRLAQALVEIGDQLAGWGYFDESGLNTSMASIERILHSKGDGA